jgi:hypothetical protein
MAQHSSSPIKTGGSGLLSRATDNCAPEGEEARTGTGVTIGRPGPLPRATTSTPVPISSVLSDFTLEEDDCNPINEITNLTPVVIICESSRSHSTKRIIRQLLSVPIGPSLGLILSIFRKPRNSMTFIEVLYTQFSDKILSSQENADFPFQVRLSDHITFPPDEITARWITEGATCHLRIDIPYNDERLKVVLKLWEQDRKEASSLPIDESTLKWKNTHKLQHQKLPRSNPQAPTTQKTFRKVPVERRIEIEDDGSNFHMMNSLLIKLANQ